MKITTWNVNGLRAILEKDAWSWVQLYQPEVLCLQEIKARPDQLKPAVMQWFSDTISAGIRLHALVIAG